MANHLQPKLTRPDNWRPIKALFVLAGNEGFGPNSTGIIPAWLPVELGCCAGVSLLPLHSAVATSRLTSRLSTTSRSCCTLSPGYYFYSVAADDGDDDDCVVLDGDPAAVGVKEERPVEGVSEEELQIVAEKGELACRDFPHPRHLCVSMPFSTSSHADHCTLCHCYVCDCPAPCANWGKGTKLTDHCHATDKDWKWEKMRKALKLKIQPAAKRKNIQEFFQPSSVIASMQQYTESHLPVSQSFPSRLGEVQPSPVGFRVSSNVGQNQMRTHPPIGVAQNVGQAVNLPKPSPPWANVLHKRFRTDGTAPRLYSSANDIRLRRPVPNPALVQPTSFATIQKALSQSASSTVFQNSLSPASTFRAYSLQNSLNAPVISQGLGVHPASYLRVAPGMSQGPQVLPKSYLNLQVAPGGMVSTEPQLSRCSSLPARGIQWQQDPSADTDQKKMYNILATLASELGVSDYNVDPPLGQQSAATPQPSQLHAQMRPDHLLTQVTARQGVEANHSHAAATSQMRTSNVHHLPNHNPGDSVHAYGSMHQNNPSAK
ncbi:hypothetical protein GUJ93_ZPchr0006g44043 [Zizania palustris]|uniref:Uncharacterized protein n=1 Tax=Zizania palustris TaxID=103762 RepID=A0A8J5SP29_ZIZPA|nr:hypothetical protein GUJ93_ZPchr0006g44043 [Zizania palustris]